MWWCEGGKGVVCGGVRGRVWCVVYMCGGVRGEGCGVWWCEGKGVVCGGVRGGKGGDL